MNFSQQSNRVSANKDTRHEPKKVAAWLYFCCIWLTALVVVGGSTRLTHSGLSITEWQPLVGTLPPLNVAQWEELFAKYQATPEFRLVNSSMDLQGFKGIFWWEWVHRFLARGLGMVYAIPLFYFIFRRQITGVWARRLCIFLAIGGAQGLWGWLMVKSGLVEQPWVSPVRLAGHLGLAFLLFVLMLGSALMLRAENRGAMVAREPSKRDSLVLWLGVAIFVQSILGALVAGLRAGLIYNTFPKMNGLWIPPGLWAHEPWWLNLVDNGTMVQFVHRNVAGAVTVAALALALYLRKQARTVTERRDAVFLAGAIFAQVGLGILTLLMRVPIVLGVCHQLGALLLLAVVTRIWGNLRANPATSEH
jgi:cytochrome c oxidase assembly protein subunit 15